MKCELRKYYDNIIKNKKKCILGLIIVLAILIRIAFFNFVSRDYEIFLNRWLDHLKNNNGIFGIQTLKTDYNIPYLLFLSLINYIPIKNIYLIKILSCIFDFMLAKLGYDVINYFTKNEKYSILGFATILFLPTVIINSALLGQCDSIYTFFALSSIFYLIKKEYSKSFVFLGIAFSLKLQTAFIFPIYVILYLKEKIFPFKYFLYVPLTNFILCLPGHLAGANLFYTYEKYFLQAKEYTSTTAINIVRLLPYYNNLVNYILLAIAAIIFLVFAIKCYKIKKEITNKQILTIVLIYIVSCYYFLPFMHERYMYMADILCIIWYEIHRKDIVVPIAISYCSILGYLLYIFGNINVDIYFGLYNFILPGIIILLIAIYKLYLYFKRLH